ncbi:Wadjet anti-phage system protein JetD domain-containing protein [Treponema sp.]|uniref:Wadjet anti-phage system protein JetD domain-containing protein n=1 Tax=Treponema sp. TaxID=166 RepID=UPI00388FA106
MIYSNIQKQILLKLLTKYESSKTYKGENTVLQSFSTKPSDIFKDYEKDSTDINAIEDFEKQCKSLESEKLIQIDWKYGRISKLISIATEKNWNTIRTILGVKDKKERHKEEIDFYISFYNNPDFEPIVKDFCKNQIERLENDKEAEYLQEDSKNIIALLNYILKNENEILERELSISVLANSKTWEEKYKRKVLKVLRQSGYFDSLIDNCVDEKEINKVILEECNVYSNPSYLYFKGNGKITFENDKTFSVYYDIPLALSSQSINKIKSLEIADSKIMTVENLTSFNRIKDSETFFIFLSGYHNSVKQKFLEKIYQQNLNKEYYHFGDLDPDGFFILENLQKKTHIDFKPYKMGIEELKKYSDFSKTLEENDITKANSLIEEGKFVEIMNYMLENNIKLEQEIISWKELFFEQKDDD